MAKQRTPAQEAMITPPPAEVVVDNFDENKMRDRKIVSMFPQFNVNQIASMMMIPKHVVEQVLKDNE